jgi:lipid-binding SYLF domain-containing protein
VGRDASAATDAKPKADIYSYSRSKGVFAGVSLEGAGLTSDDDANTAFYGKLQDRKLLLSGQNKPYPAPKLLEILKKYAVRK